MNVLQVLSSAPQVVAQHIALDKQTLTEKPGQRAHSLQPVQIPAR